MSAAPNLGAPQGSIQNWLANGYLLKANGLTEGLIPASRDAIQ
jgi:hypothetical protein